MSTWFGTSTDGLAWLMHGPAMTPTEGAWDQRGARLTAVLPADTSPGLSEASGIVALYDGRASAEENFRERTGVGLGIPDRLVAAGGPVPAASGRALRYVSLAQTPAGLRAYFEVTTDDGSHALVTTLVP